MTPALKQRVRRLIAHGSYRLGVLHLRQRLTLRGRAVVLMYHRVLPTDLAARSWSHPGIMVTPDTFEQHMRLLRRRFRVLSLSEFQARLDGGDGFENGSCLVTFDDGWFDTYTHAFPILRRYDIPALVFLPSAYIGSTDTFWQEALGRILHDIWDRVRTDPAVAAAALPALEPWGLEGVLTLPAEDIRHRLLGVVRQRKSRGLADPFAPVKALSRLVRPHDPSQDVDRFMDWDQVRTMRSAGITFGAHGHTHRQLTALARPEVRAEIETSSQLLEQALGERPASFSYPNGDWNADVADQLRHSTFSIGFATRAAAVGAGVERFAVPRINIHEGVTGDVPMFLARVVGAFG